MQVERTEKNNVKKYFVKDDNGKIKHFVISGKIDNVIKNI